jgi:hypothetical protein
MFQLNTSGLAAGSYTFYCTIGNDPAWHSLSFSVGGGPTLSGLILHR